MSRVWPFPLNLADELRRAERGSFCPKYIEWIKRVGSFDFSKRKNVKLPKVRSIKRKTGIDRAPPSEELFETYNSHMKHMRHQSTSSNPSLSISTASMSTLYNNKTSKKSLIATIRRGGKNFKVRCKTSAELWRKWISRGPSLGDEVVDVSVEEKQLDGQNKGKVISKGKTIGKSTKEHQRGSGPASVVTTPEIRLHPARDENSVRIKLKDAFNSKEEINVVA